MLEAAGFDLAFELFEPEHDELAPAVVIVHGFPSGPAGNSYTGMPSLAQRVAKSLGWVAMSFSFRGVGDSVGDFSLRGWFDDLGMAAEAIASHERSTGVWLVGFGTGGALSVCVAAANPEVSGVATIGAPADFDDWARSPRDLLDWARDRGAVTNPEFPENFESWSDELTQYRAAEAAEDLGDRPLLVMHGSADDVVPALDARALADSHGSASLRILEGSGHNLRHDPRAIAVLLSWLDSQGTAKG
ncbi:MAG: alpha/beta fold hydrolase [Acidimicrobiales bacterium]